ncbi:MAG: hypothetical protein K6G38_00485 [Gammaproteobacteria bacterium]|nr:hypothetical protein [Gammaproteobacteria bacterium]
MSANIYLLAIKDTFIDVFSKIIYSIVRSLLLILYYIERTFMILAGSEPIMGSKGENTYGILNDIIYDDRTKKVFLFAFYFGIGLFVVCLIIGIVKSQINKNSAKETKKVIVNFFKTILYFVFIPFIFIFSTRIVSEIILLIVNNVGRIITGNEIKNTISSSISNTLWLNFFSSNDKKTLLNYGYTFDYTYEEISEKVSLVVGDTSFNYLLAIIVTTIMLIALGIAVLKLAERILEIIFLYIISPPLIATNPLDDGERYDNWKEKVVLKLLSIVGTIISMYVYILVFSIVSNIIDEAKGNVSLERDKTILSFIFMFITIAGALITVKGGKTLSGILSRKGKGKEVIDINYYTNNKNHNYVEHIGKNYYTNTTSRINKEYNNTLKSKSRGAYNHETKVYNSNLSKLNNTEVINNTNSFKRTINNIFKKKTNTKNIDASNSSISNDNDKKTYESFEERLNSLR